MTKSILIQVLLFLLTTGTANACDPSSKSEDFKKCLCPEAWGVFFPESESFAASNVKLQNLQYGNPDDSCVNNIYDKELERLNKEVKKAAGAAFSKSKKSFEVMVRFSLTADQPASFEMLVKNTDESASEMLNNFKAKMGELKNFHSKSGTTHVVIHYVISPMK